jgi:D-galactarolactone isomerase
MIARRTFLKTASAAGIASDLFVSAGQAQQIPNSSGSKKPKLKAPSGACDCHHHIYDAVRFPPSQPGGRFQSNARVEEYRLLQRRIGTTRNIVVTPAPYVGNNRITLDAITKFGPNARGIAALRPDVSDGELKALADGGIRGVRFTLARPELSYSTVAMIEPLAKRVNDLGWHVQFNMRGDQIVAAADLLNRLPTPIVFDHMGMLRGTEGIQHPAFDVIRRLIDKGRTWVKLSAAYTEIKTGPSGEISFSTTSNYEAATKIAQAYVKAAPERMVWGSDWPHPNAEDTDKPDDAVLFDLLSAWAPNEAIRHRILVQNPENLYGFPKFG